MRILAAVGPRSAAPRERERREADENNEQDGRGEGADERPRDALAEGAELLADGEPVGPRVALVRQIKPYHVKEDKDRTAIPRPGPDDVHDGHRQRQDKQRLT